MTAKHARYLSTEAARAEDLLKTWPIDPGDVGTAQAIVAYLRSSLAIEADMLTSEEIQQFGETI